MKKFDIWTLWGGQEGNNGISLSCAERRLRDLADTHKGSVAWEGANLVARDRTGRMIGMASPF